MRFISSVGINFRQFYLFIDLDIEDRCFVNLAFASCSFFYIRQNCLAIYSPHRNLQNSLLSASDEIDSALCLSRRISHAIDCPPCVLSLLESIHLSSSVSPRANASQLFTGVSAIPKDMQTLSERSTPMLKSER